MKIITNFIPINAVTPKRKAVAFDKSETNADATKQEGITPVNTQEKRRGEDRRKRNLKPLIDTRSGRDRRYEKNKNSIDTKA